MKTIPKVIRFDGYNYHLHEAFVPEYRRQELFDVAKKAGEEKQSFDDVLVYIARLQSQFPDMYDVDGADMAKLEHVWREFRWPEQSLAPLEHYEPPPLTRTLMRHPPVIQHRGHVYKLVQPKSAASIQPHINRILEFYPDSDVDGGAIRDLWRFVDEPQYSDDVEEKLNSLFTRITGLSPDHKHEQYIRLKKILREGRFTKKNVLRNPAPLYLLNLLHADAKNIHKVSSENYRDAWQRIKIDVEEFFRKSDVRDMQRQREPERTRKRKSTTTYYGKKLIQWLDEIRKRDPKEYWWQVFDLVYRVLKQENPGMLDVYSKTSTRLNNVFRFNRPKTTGDLLKIHHRVLPPDPGIRERLRYRYVYDRVVNPGSILKALNKLDWDALINHVYPNIKIPPEVLVDGSKLIHYLQHANIPHQTDADLEFLAAIAKDDLLSLRSGFPTFGLGEPGTKRNERYLLKDLPDYMESDEALDEMLQDDPDALVQETTSPVPIRGSVGNCKSTVPSFWFGTRDGCGVSGSTTNLFVQGGEHVPFFHSIGPADLIVMFQLDTATQEKIVSTPMLEQIQYLLSRNGINGSIDDAMEYIPGALSFWKYNFDTVEERDRAAGLLNERLFHILPDYVGSRLYTNLDRKEVGKQIKLTRQLMSTASVATSQKVLATTPAFWFDKRTATVPVPVHKPGLMELLYDYLDPLADWHVRQPSNDSLFMTIDLTSPISVEVVIQYIEKFVRQHPDLFGQAKTRTFVNGKVWETLTGESVAVAVDQNRHELVVAVRPYRK